MCGVLCRCEVNENLNTKQGGGRPPLLLARSGPPPGHDTLGQLSRIQLPTAALHTYSFMARALLLHSPCDISLKAPLGPVVHVQLSFHAGSALYPPPPPPARMCEHAAQERLVGRFIVLQRGHRHERESFESASRTLPLL